jgi:hypothetical protein
LNVTFFCALEESFALLLPNDSALLPPLCICRMKKIQKPIIRRIGAQEYSSAAQGLAVGSRAATTTPRSISLLARPSYCGGAKVRKLSLALVVPVISLPVIVTRAIWPASTEVMNSLKFNAFGLVWNFVEKFHTRTPTTTRTIQNTRLLSVEFKPCLLKA